MNQEIPVEEIRAALEKIANIHIYDSETNDPYEIFGICKDTAKDALALLKPCETLPQFKDIIGLYADDKPESQCKTNGCDKSVVDNTAYCQEPTETGEDEDCVLWTIVGTKTYKKCAQIYKLEAKIELLQKELDNVSK